MSSGQPSYPTGFAEGLFAPFLVIRAPGSVGAFPAMASTPPVPFAGIAKEDVHTQHPLDANFNLV
ncbi:MAG: hypothetical protein D4R82_04990 [Dehalococcoidia bacterium]|nr:MAG: hypothetical protein D4R82_04990 [Dehalococcoidia bacterium]